MRSAAPTAGRRATDQAAIPTDLALAVKLLTVFAEEAAPIPWPLLLVAASVTAPLPDAKIPTSFLDAFTWLSTPLTVLDPLKSLFEEKVNAQR